MKRHAFKPGDLAINPAICYAIPSVRSLERGTKEGRYRQSEGQLEKRCRGCNEYWPADTEFFYRHSTGADGLQSYCKACHTAMQEASIEKNRRAA